MCAWTWRKTAGIWIVRNKCLRIWISSRVRQSKPWGINCSTTIYNTWPQFEISKIWNFKVFTKERNKRVGNVSWKINSLTWKSFIIFSKNRPFGAPQWRASKWVKNTYILAQWFRIEIWLLNRRAGPNSKWTTRLENS